MKNLKNEPVDSKNLFLEVAKIIIMAVLIAIGIRTFLYEPFTIPSGSMKPNLLVGDYLFVSKFSYGYSRYSLPFGLPFIPGRLFFTEPERGDVIVFKKTDEPSVNYIKRLVGLPGDRIQLKRGILHVNGQPIKRELVEDIDDKTIIREMEKIRARVIQYKETMPNEKEYAVWEWKGVEAYDDTEVYIVGENHYFFLGDNRDNSLDSRFFHEETPVPRENLIGRAEFIVFSINSPFWKFWEWKDTFRSERVFMPVY